MFVTLCMGCRCYPETVIWRNLSGHACGICHWLLSTTATLARSRGSGFALNSFTWLVISKRCNTLHLVYFAVVCKKAVCCIIGRKQPTLKRFQKVDVGQSLEKGAPFPGGETKALELLTVHRQGGVLGKRSHSNSFCYFAFLTQFRSPNLHLLFLMLLRMCDWGECETWVLNFVGNTDLLFWCCKTLFTAPISFQKPKYNYVFPLRHIFDTSLKVTCVAGDF